MKLAARLSSDKRFGAYTALSTADFASRLGSGRLPQWLPGEGIGQHR